MSVDQISDNCFISSFDSQGAGVVVTFSDSTLAESRDSIVTTGRLNKKVRSWGSRNSLPQYREQLVMENNIIPSLISTKCDITLGSGLFAYKEEFVADGGKRNIIEVKMPSKIQEWLDKVDIDDYLDKAVKNLYMHANVFTEFTRTKGGEIDMMTAKECRHTRSGIQNDAGRVTEYFLSGSWARDPQSPDKLQIKDPVSVPAYDPQQKQVKFMYHTGDTLLGDDYYYVPTWWGDIHWIELSNAIPVFHKANIRNGYTIRFHIEVPKGYFDEKVTAAGSDALKRAEEVSAAKKLAFMEKVNDILAGVENTGRALFTEYNLNVALGKDMPGIKITPINVDIKDQALLKLFEKSNEANISSQGIHPTLANIQTQGKLSSGSEIRNAFLMYLTIKTPKPRRILLRPINKIVRKDNDWPMDIQLGFRDMEITTLDDNPAGLQEVVTQ